jgi:hypothetical protein
VIGTGSFVVGGGHAGSLEFSSSVGPAQSVSVGNDLPGLSTVLKIDLPREFLGSTTLNSSGEIDLMGLATADSYTYDNDMLLRIYSGSSIIETLPMTNITAFGFVVEPPTPTGSVNIVAIADPTNPPIGLPPHNGV